MIRYIYRISGDIYFPEGIMPGEGRQSNVLSVARDGLGRPILRGTSLAGALRSEYSALFSKKDFKLPDNIKGEEYNHKKSVDYWFGRPLESKDDVSEDSRVIVADMVLYTGKSRETVRTHNIVNRHTGVVIDHGLFSMESLPPGTSAKLLIYINPRNSLKYGSDTQSSDKNSTDDTSSADRSFANDSFFDETLILEALRNILGSGITLGGNRNRGVGRLVCKDANCKTNLVLHRFDITSSEGYAKWMNARYADRAGKDVSGGEEFELKSQSEDFVIDLTLAIPRGEDIVVGYGATMEHQQEPQIVMKADGIHYWRIPGSTFRGVFRGWMSRLAVLDGYKLRDDATGYMKKYYSDELKAGELEYSGENIGWGFIEKENRKFFQESPDSLNDPIMYLFGSLYKKGRIHFTDGYSIEPADINKDTQIRAHVAVDRFSGGANEGMLFDNRVLIGDIRFQSRITINNPTDYEIKWLEKSLKALHLGILNFGSSKGAGRLEIYDCKAITQTAENLANNIEELLEVNDG